LPSPKDVVVGWKKFLPQTCGVGELGHFRFEGDPEACATSPKIQNVVVDKSVSGCGWIIASFTPSRKDYKEAYNQLKERFGEPIFQSDTRVNKRTNHKFFFCIFDTKDKP
jgi:hypothetical protein